MTLFTRDELLATSVRFSHRRDVRFQDIDAAGIMFYARFFDLFHDVYADYLAGHGAPLPDVIRKREWAAPLGHAEADYLAPLRYGDSIEVALTRGALEGSRLQLGYRITRGDRVVSAIGQTVHVFVDVTTFKKIAPPAEALAAMGVLLA
jgi:1,4-dihydroxy-2-naphthoyl-CoA hydrolase